MKNFKQWLLILMATFMFVGIATGCTNEEPQEETETEEGAETEDNTEEGAKEEAE